MIGDRIISCNIKRAGPESTGVNPPLLLGMIATAGETMPDCVKHIGRYYKIRPVPGIYPVPDTQLYVSGHYPAMQFYWNPLPHCITPLAQLLEIIGREKFARKLKVPYENQHITVEDLLTDEGFLAWFKKTDKRCMAAWNKWIKENREHAYLAKKAVQLLSILLKPDERTIPKQAVHASFARMLQK